MSRLISAVRQAVAGSGASIVEFQEQEALEISQSVTHKELLTRVGGSHAVTLKERRGMHTPECSRVAWRLPQSACIAHTPKPATHSQAEAAAVGLRHALQQGGAVSAGREPASAPANDAAALPGAAAPVVAVCIPRSIAYITAVLAAAAAGSVRAAHRAPATPVRRALLCSPAASCTACPCMAKRARSPCPQPTSTALASYLFLQHGVHAAGP
jgi:hypothetical protein